MAKICVEDCYRLPVKVLVRYPAPCSGRVTWSVNKQQIGSISFLRLGLLLVELEYTVSGEGMRYQVQLNTTPLPWGALRYWFTCPSPGCQRRVRDLYLPSGAELFACRHCQELAYRSNQTESRTVNELKRLF